MLKYYNFETQTLSIPWDFNDELKKLPQDLKIIIFEEDDYKFQYSTFNKPVNNLPENLTHLTFGSKFNQQVNNFTSSLTHLTFGYGFNKPVDDLPENLTHLIFGFCFNQPVDNLPKNLTHLTFGV